MRSPGLFFLLLLLAPIFPSVSSVLSWSAPQRFTSTLGDDQQPEPLQALDGTVWLFWHTSTFDNPIPHIHFRTSSNLVDWSTEQSLVASSGQDVAPSAAQLGNGTIYVSFSSNRNGNFDIYLKKYSPSTGWSSDYQITQHSNDEIISSLVAARDGSLWVFWDRRAATNASIYYKVYNSQGWSPEAPLTPGTYVDRQPSAIQTSDGRIWAAWSHTIDSQFKKVYVYYRILTGQTWSGEIQRTFLNSPDRHPELFQDSEGTVWLFWSRELQITGTTFQEDLMYISSTDNGANWSPEAKLTNDRNNEYDDVQPAMAQLKDHRIWIFWLSNRDPENWWDTYYATSSLLAAHDVAVTGLDPSPLKLRRGSPVSISVTVANKGTYTETFTLTVQASNVTSVTVASQTVTLTPGASQTLTYSWSTGTVPPGKYRISASIPGVSGESQVNLYDNSLTYGTVWLVPPGDVDIDGDVDIIDAGTLAYAYGTSVGDSRYNPSADLDSNGRVDISDAAVMALWYGTVT